MTASASCASRPNAAVSLGLCLLLLPGPPCQAAAAAAGRGKGPAKGPAAPKRRYNSYAGPYDIMFKECTQCPEGVIEKQPMLNLTGNWRHSRAFNGMIFDGDLWIGMNVDPGDVGVKLRVAKWDTVAGWRDNFFNMDGGEYCNVMALIGQPVSAELAKVDPNFPTSCPIPKGEYHFHNLSSHQLSRYNHFPVFPYGRFRGDVMFYEFKSKLVLSCIRGVAEVQPKA